MVAAGIGLFQPIALSSCRCPALSRRGRAVAPPAGGPGPLALAVPLLAFASMMLLGRAYRMVRRDVSR